MVALMVWGIVFALIYAIPTFWTTPANGGRIFNSPDESANFFFTKLFTENNSLEYPEPLNQKFENTIHPRAMRVSKNGGLILESFQGIVFIYGMIAKFFGTWSIVYITSLFSLFGTLYFYKLLKEFFSQKISLFSSLLLLFFPGWWYYNSRSMFHNILFVNLIIFSLYNLIKSQGEKKYFHIVASSIFLGLALFTRTSEAIWVIPVFILILLFKAPKKSWRHIFVFFFVLTLFFISIFYLNKTLYANIFTGGYVIEGEFRTLRSAFKVIFPFGLSIKKSFIHFFQYYPTLFWWYCVPFFFGALATIAQWKEISKSQKQYFIIFFAVFIFLTLYYGSWDIRDSISPEKITLGTSYVRYWLPIYIFSLPYVASCFEKIFARMQSLRLRVAWSFVFWGIIVFFSYSLVWIKGDESLSHIQKSIQGYYIKREAVSHLIPEDSFIITEKSDKVFFPEFKILIGAYDQRIINAMKNILANDYPLYYYTHQDKKDIQKIRSKLLENQIYLQERIKIFNNEYIYTLATNSKKKE